MTSATHTAVLIAVSLLLGEKMVAYCISLSLSLLLAFLLQRSLSFLFLLSHLSPCFLHSRLITLLFFQPSHQKSNGGTVTLHSDIKCVHFNELYPNTFRLCVYELTFSSGEEEKTHKTCKTLGPSLSVRTG